MNSFYNILNDIEYMNIINEKNNKNLEEKLGHILLSVELAEPKVKNLNSYSNVCLVKLLNKIMNYMNKCLSGIMDDFAIFYSVCYPNSSISCEEMDKDYKLLSRNLSLVCKTMNIIKPLLQERVNKYYDIKMNGEIVGNSDEVCIYYYIYFKFIIIFY
jgi:hypothetical protein